MTGLHFARCQPTLSQVLEHHTQFTRDNYRLFRHGHSLPKIGLKLHFGVHIGLETTFRVSDAKAHSPRTADVVQIGVNVVHLALKLFTGQIRKRHGNGHALRHQGQFALVDIGLHPDLGEIGNTQKRHPGLVGGPFHHILGHHCATDGRVHGDVIEGLSSFFQGGDFRVGHVPQCKPFSSGGHQSL